MPLRCWHTCPVAARGRGGGKSQSEDETGSDRGKITLQGSSARKVIKSFPGTMARYQIIRIDLLKSHDDLPDVIVGQRRHDVEAANDRMDLLDAGNALCLSDCIDDAVRRYLSAPNIAAAADTNRASTSSPLSLSFMPRSIVRCMEGIAFLH